MMRRPARALVAIVAGVTLPVLAGCYTTARTAVPPSHPNRQELELRGVVVTDPDNGEEEVIEFAELHEATWTPRSLSFVADVGTGATSQTITRLVPITELDGVIVRQLDAGKTSGILAGVLVGAFALMAVALTGQADTYR